MKRLFSFYFAITFSISTIVVNEKVVWEMLKVLLNPRPRVKVASITVKIDDQTFGVLVGEKQGI